MENGGLADQFGSLTTNDGKDNSSLLQVMMAVEVAEATIKQQVPLTLSKNLNLLMECQKLEWPKKRKFVAYGLIFGLIFQVISERLDLFVLGIAYFVMEFFRACLQIQVKLQHE